MQINKRQLKKWIAALDSGEYEQGKFFLQNEKKFCCLGVGCKVLMPPDKLRLLHNGVILGQKPEDQPNAPEWFREINLDFELKTQVQLTHLNDYGMFYGMAHPGSEALEPFTFPEIATLLELVYVHKMLD